MSENKLKFETSPYLLQHKDNPVHWRPWGPEALAEAKSSGKPILLSVGYAACHWCHVMAHESFEHVETADVMNELFVNIKVDREERPDIDAIYMGALHNLGQQGGWPLTMFLDADARPYWGGTYFPREPMFGRPAFVDVLRQAAQVVKEQPDKVAHNAEVITQALTHQPQPDHALNVTEPLIADLTQKMVRAIDPEHGGISGAPKFPQWTFFWLLWRGAIRFSQSEAASAVENTLLHICQGGIYDHLGGGFARYSVDERWLAPHFEKMLYDNALLIDLMCEVYRETQTPLFKARIEETIDWLKREMIAEGGGFAASLDADSEGKEGKFYVWDLQEITDVLGPEDTKTFARIYDVTEGGNWEGHNILNRLDSLEFLEPVEEGALADMRAKLFEKRAERIRPGWDDKVLADWNGLMIAALCNAARTFDRPDWLQLAREAFHFIEDSMFTDQRLQHAWRLGRTTAPATSADYANLIWAALRLHQTTNESKYLDRAIELTDTLHRHYWLTDKGRYAATADDTDDVIVRLSNGTDDATPNANGIMISNLSNLALLTGDDRYREQATMIVESFTPDIAASIISHNGLLAGALDLISPTQVFIAGSDLPGAAELDHALRKLSLPGALAYSLPSGSAAPTTPLEGKASIDGKAAAYVCIGPQCSAPVTDADALTELISKQRAAPM